MINTAKNIIEEILWDHLNAIEEQVKAAISNGKATTIYTGFYTDFSFISVFNNKLILDKIIPELRTAGYTAFVDKDEDGDRIVDISWNKNG